MLASPPNPPTNVSVESLNCATALVHWDVPVSRLSEPLNNLTVPSEYNITARLSGSTVVSTESTSETFHNLTALPGGSVLSLNVSAINAFGESEAVMIGITLPNCTAESATPTTSS